MFTYLAYIFTGAFTGTMAGLLGLGGGIIIVPMLALTFAHSNLANGAEMHLAAGTSLAAVSITGLFATYSHHQRNNVIWPIFWKLVPGIITGTILGAIFASFLSTPFLASLFACFMLCIALYMFFFPEANSTWQLPGKLILFLCGLFIGIISGLFGLGGGIVIAPLLILFNVSPYLAAGTSAACGIPISLVGMLAYIVIGWSYTQCGVSWECGYIYWPAALIIALTSILFIPLGAYFSKRLPIMYVKNLFIILIIVTAIRMFWI